MKSAHRVALVALAAAFVTAVGSLGGPGDLAAAPGTAAPAPRAGTGTAVGGATAGVYVDATLPASAAAIRRSGARLVADYGEFALWRIPEADLAAAVAAGATPAGDLDHLDLRGRTIDTARDTEPTAPTALRAAAAGATSLWLVQFAGPVKPEWLAALEAEGLRAITTVPPNGYVVQGNAKSTAALRTLGADDPMITYVGPYRPVYRMAPELLDRKPGSGPVEVTVQLVAGARADLDAALAAGTPVAPTETIPEVGLTNVHLRVPTHRLVGLAALPTAVNVEPYVRPRRNDEAQGQILAGNLLEVGGKSVPSGPGYLATLAAKGVSSLPVNHPIVAVIDDGVDNGTNAPRHPDFYRDGAKVNPSRVVFNADCTGGANPRGVAGHGNINASIIGGYNNGTGSSNEDPAGYNYGLGIDPYARIANIKIFTDGGEFALPSCKHSVRGIGEREVAAGARISSNSWGAPIQGVYDSTAQAYDVMTRDASAAVAGQQPMLYVFSAGNSGPGPSTLGSPGTAKNVLTVGATENVRDDGVFDGCDVDDSDNADDMADFSSRGPTSDGRAKPDVVAPGVHIQGAASQAFAYDGTGVCGPKYYPSGQTKYTWSSGTSHSAPAVAGAAALAHEYYKRVVQPGTVPSPAMLKAMLMSSPRYLDGVDSGGTLPGTAQGWGDIDLDAMLVPGRFALDQSTTFTATGQQLTRHFTVASSSEPTRITLAYTDAPGSTVGKSFVNNLDLVVVANGRLYRGNVFSGALSTPAGTADKRNNVEQVFLPAGFSGRVAVQVVARNIAGNGVPGGTNLDQDFALTAVNLTPASTPTVLPYIGGVVASDAAPGGNANGAIEPGEVLGLRTVIGNFGTGTAPAGSMTVSIPPGSEADVIAASTTTPTVAAGAQATTTGTSVRYRASATCGGSFGVRLSYVLPGSTTTADLTFQSTAGGTPVTVISPNVPRAIPDNNAAGVNSTLTSTEPGSIASVRLNATHSFTGDVRIRLRSPNGTVVTLIDREGGSGNNFVNTVLSDSASVPISAGLAPFTGTFRPEEPLATFTGSSVGTWTLNVADLAAVDLGTLTGWRAEFRTCAPPPSP